MQIRTKLSARPSLITDQSDRQVSKQGETVLVAKMTEMQLSSAFKLYLYFELNVVIDLIIIY